ncbi:MAG: lipoate--protein ligase family protein [Planctomycetaceae bacterium]
MPIHGLGAFPACRVLVDREPGSGAWNMALDEVLLGDALHHGRCNLRLYRWRKPTVSLGHFQPVLPETMPPALRKLPVVRRLSGGGAIVHDQELTYSCTLPPDHPLSRTPRSAYDVLHDAIIASLAEIGIVARRRATFEPARQEEFLCFGRGDPSDILIAGQKVVGSAQRRRKGAVLQHGSLILRRSVFAAEFPGLLDLSGLAEEPPGLTDVLAQKLGSALARQPTPGTLEPQEIEQASDRERE